MRSLFRFLPVVLLALVAVGCTPDTRMGPSGEPKGTLTHVVLCWMYDRGDEKARNEILGEGKKMEHMSGVVNVVGGRVLQSDRPMVDNTFDVALMFTFHSESDLKRFVEDKDQNVAMTNVLRYAKVKVYDFIAE